MNKKLVVNWLDTVDSTNLEAMRQLSDAGEGTVWIADYQTAGRGQRGNSWESTKGMNLTFTLLLRPGFVAAQDQFIISQVTALGIIKYLEKRGLDAKIKWPNDVYIGERKICGILIEHLVGGANLSASILGIGVNLNQTLFASDAPNPTSLILETNGFSPKTFRETDNPPFLKEYDRKQELPEVLSCIFSLYETVRAGGWEEVEQAYLSRLFRWNEYHGYVETGVAGESRFEARITGVDRNGCLVLETKEGIRKSYAFKEIRYVL